MIQSRAMDAASNGIVIADARQPDCPLVYVNAAFLRITGYTEAEVLGRNYRFLQGAETDRDSVRELREAIEQKRGCQVLIRNYRKDGTFYWNEATLSPVRDERGEVTHFVGVQTDVTVRQVTDAALERRAEREQFLAELGERARRLSDPDEVITDAVNSVGQFLGASRCVFADIDIVADICTIPPDYRAAESVTSMAGTFPISAFGPYLVAAYGAGRTVVVNNVCHDPEQVPADYLSAYEAVGVRAFVAVPVLHSARLVSVIAVHSDTPRKWTPDEVALVKLVVERTWLTIEIMRQQRTLAREAKALREANEGTTLILENISDGFYFLDREWRFRYINAQGEQVLRRPREELLGKNIWEEFPEAIGGAFYTLYHRVMEEGTPASFEEYYPPLETWVNLSASPSSAGLSVFFQNITARKQAEQEREKTLAEQRWRAEREALLNRLGQTIRTASTPQQVLETAVREIAQALSADRSYYASYNQAGDVTTVGPDWFRAGLTTLAGVYSLSSFIVDRDPDYFAGRTQALTSTTVDSTLSEFGLRALIRVPLVSNTSLSALCVAMVDGPREWTPEEISLVEAVATQTQSAVEAVRMRQYEHRIAEQLQAALQPPLPPRVAGLRLSKHYETALEEAGVGGDFYDVFPLSDDCTILAVGDLSGKGLQAASEVSIVRNMLRAFLYSQTTLAEAATGLNRVLAQNQLLSGFATLWAGCYDPSNRELAYVNLGQEPALLRRAVDGALEQLMPTGPVLGALEDTVYTQRTVTLFPGDALVIFSDGVTECGPNRREMLGMNGVLALLGQPFAPEETQNAERMAKAVTRRLVLGTETVSRGCIATDDICILVGVVEG